MTLDCPFRNPLQSRVTSVRSYYLTSYGYLHFYWIRFTACSIQQLEYSHTTDFFAMITAFCSSYVRPSLVGHSVLAVWYLPLGAACLPVCRSVSSGSNWRSFRGPQMFLRLYAQNPSWSLSSFADLLLLFPSLTVCSVVYSLQFF